MNRRWLSGRIREAYLFLFIPSSFSLVSFLFYFLLPCYLGRLFFKEKASGYVTRGLKDGPSRHPEKVYPGGEGHERGGRGEGRGQLRQRLYGGSKLTAAHLASLIYLLAISSLLQTFSPSYVHLFLCTDPPYPTPSRLRVPCIPQEVRQGRLHCPLPFPPISGFTWRPSFVSQHQRHTTGSRFSKIERQQQKGTHFTSLHSPVLLFYIALRISIARR